MAYTDFQGDLEKLEEMFELRLATRDLFDNRREAVAPQWLSQTLKQAFKLALVKEKERSEFLVAPVLLAAREITDEAFAIYSGHNLNVSFEAGLIGECDFLLTKTESLPVVKAPIITLVEAKNQDMISGFGQCAAQMIGAKIFNESEGNSLSTIFGCVTTGETWQFMKLEANELAFDSRRYYVANVSEILGVFAAIIAYYEK